MGLSDSIVSLFLTLGAVFAFVTLAVCVFMVVGYLIMKDGTRNALNEADRNSIMAEMFTEARSHVAHSGGALLDEAMLRLEGGLRAIMPAHVKNMEFEWLENPEAFDFECRGSLDSRAET